MRIKLFSLCITILVFFGGCSTDNKVKITKSKDGIIVYSNKSTPVNPDLTIRLKKEFSIEKHSSSESGIQVMYNVVLLDNNIYISDYYSSMIFTFNKFGKYLYSFGGKGNGPGEFQELSSMGIYQDTILVSDAASCKINKFSKEGKFIYSNNEIMHPPTEFNNLNNDFFISSRLKSEKVKNKMIIKNDLMVHDTKFNCIKTLQSFKIPVVNTGNITNVNLSEIIPAYTISNNSIYIALISYDRYVIEQYNESLEKISEIRKNYMRTMLSDKQKKILSQNYYSKVKNVVTDIYQRSIWGLYADRYDRLWVLGAYEQKGKELKFDIFENGQFINTVDFPYFSSILTFDEVINHIKFVGKYIIVEEEEKIVFYSYD